MHRLLKGKFRFIFLISTLVSFFCMGIVFAPEASAQAMSQGALAEQSSRILTACQCDADGGDDCSTDAGFHNRCAAACMEWSSAAVSLVDELTMEPRRHRELELIVGAILALVVILGLGSFMTRRRAVRTGATLLVLIVPGLLAFVVGMAVNRLPAEAGDDAGAIGRGLNQMHQYSQGSSPGQQCATSLSWFLDPNTEALLTSRLRAGGELQNVLRSENTVPTSGPSLDDLPQETQWSVLLRGHRELYVRLRTESSEPLTGVDWLRGHPILRDLYSDKQRAWSLLPVAAESDPLSHAATRILFHLAIPVFLTLLFWMIGSKLWRRSWLQQ